VRKESREGVKKKKKHMGGSGWKDRKREKTKVKSETWS